MKKLEIKIRSPFYYISFKSCLLGAISRFLTQKQKFNKTILCTEGLKDTPFKVLNFGSFLSFCLIFWIIIDAVRLSSFLELESLKAWHYQDGSTPTCRKKTLKKSKFNGAKSGRKKKLIAAILFLYFEQSVCPMILNYNKVYLASSLICQT